MYYYVTEKHGALWFAYVWRDRDDATTAPPVKEFHSRVDKYSAARQAAEWIKEKNVNTSAV